MNNKLLSICIPTYNRASMLEVTLENILAQTAGHPEVEVVVSDNASTDHTQEVLGRHPGLVMDRLEQTVGVARNIGHAICRLAQGKYVWLLGDDDLVLAGAVERILAFLRDNPSLGYVYLNFGWINAKARKHVVRECGSMPTDANTRWQLDDFSAKILPRMEDLVRLPTQNASVLFSLLMCYVCRRDVYLQRWGGLEPSDSLDGSSTRLDDCFPHAKVTIEHFAGTPIGYIGQPCFMQGTGAWLWNAYAIKCNLFGISQFLQWLEGTAFDPKAIQIMWDSFYPMAGRLFSRMINSPEEHKGRDLVIDQVVRPGIFRDGFWVGMAEEMQNYSQQQYAKKFLMEEVLRYLASRDAGSSQPKIGIWGIRGAGILVIKELQSLGLQPTWVGDRSQDFHGCEVEGTGIMGSSIDSLPDASLDVLIMAMKHHLIEQMPPVVAHWLAAIKIVITTRGTYRGCDFLRSDELKPVPPIIRC